MKSRFNKDNRFDIDLKFGEGVECKLKSALEGTIEVKAERDIWLDTGNIAIEYSSRGKPSGIAVTEAKHWCQALIKDNEVVAYIVLPTKKLKAITRHFYKREKQKLVVMIIQVSLF